MTDWAIELDHVTLQYRTQKQPSLHEVTLQVAWGEKIAIIGASGSGKSSLVHLINGLIPHRYRATVTGALRVGGVDPQQAPVVETASVAGTVLQDSDAQFVGLTVAEDIAFSLENQETPAAQMPPTVRRVAERVGVAELLDQSPHVLSGGQKQRVAVGGVLVDDVDVLLFDEPLANLDPATGAAAIELIDELHRDARKTIVIVEHRLDDVLRRDVDRVVVMDAGRIVAVGTPDEIVVGGLLDELGIRPPLHLGALSAAGVEFSAEDRPARLDSMHLNEPQVTQVRDWAEAQWGRAGTDARQAQPGTPALEVRGVTCTVGATRDHEGSRALHDVDFTVQPGEFVAVLGTNGAGKSTLARVIAGFVHPESGEVKIAGKPTATMSIAEIGRRVAYVLQDPNHMISKTMIADEVALGPRAMGLADDEVQRRLEHALKVCGLWAFRSWPISALSHGQRKRVTIAAGLVMQPEILVLDEPTAGQDLRHYSEFMEFITGIHASGTTVIVITHDMHVALEYADRAIVMHGGEVVADDTPAAVLGDAETVARANLSRTSLHELAKRAGLSEAEPGLFGVTEFVATYVEAMRTRRQDAHG